MLNNKSLVNLFSAIINGYVQKKKIIKVKNNKYLFSILKFLYKEGYIFGFYTYKKKNQPLYLELKYNLNGFSFINIYKNFYVIKNFKFIKYKKLKKNFRFSNNFVLSTNFGIINGFFAIGYKIGGVIIFKLK
jgi:ribosomal protein S8